MARKADPDSQYRVSIHLNNGYRYASTQPYQIDPDTGKKSYHHIHWGRVDCHPANSLRQLLQVSGELKYQYEKYFSQSVLHFAARFFDGLLTNCSA